MNEPLNEKAHEFYNSKDKINPNNINYKFKTKGNRPKDLRFYQKQLELFKHLRYGDVNPKEVLKIK